MYNVNTELKHKPHMKQEVINCLKFDMKISWEHFCAKLSSFSYDQRDIICHELAQLHEVSSRVKAQEVSTSEYDGLYYESNDDALDEFLQAMFDCYKAWQKHDGLELTKCLYEHTNRSTDNWFPIVLIEEKVNDLLCADEYIAVYRGCDVSELTDEVYRNRQSWSTDFDVAKTFAYHHPSTKTLRNNRVVIKAVVHRDFILWARNAESEAVLAMGFEALSVVTVMTFDNFKAQGGVA